MGFFDKVKQWASPINPITTAIDFGADYLASRESRKATEDANAKAAEIAALDRASQKEFAQMGLQWRVKDAVAAGIHPLAAVGASGAGYSPSSQQLFVDDSKSNMWRNFGQNISRAALASSTARDRRLADLQLESVSLENDLLRERIISERRLRGATGPAYPSEAIDPDLRGQGDVGRDPRVIDEAARRTVSSPYDISQEAGVIPESSLAKSSTGRWIGVPGRDFKQRVEDSPFEWQAFFRMLKNPKRLPDGSKGYMNPLTGEYFTGREVINKFKKIMFGKREFD